LEIEERIKDLENILVDIINGRSVDPKLKRRLEERTGKRRTFSYKEVGGQLPPPKGGSLSFQFSGLHPASERDGGTLGWLTTTASTDLCAGLTV